MTSQGADELRARHYLHRTGAHPLGHAHDTRRTAMTTPPPPDEEPRWWSVGKTPAVPAPEPDQGSELPGVHVHITPTPPPAAAPVDDRRARARRWLLAHGAAAGVGWTFGLYDAISGGLLNPLGPGAPAAGLALAFFGWVGAEMVGERYVRVLPTRLRPPVHWALRIPMATALLATALHAPNPLI